MLEQKIEELTAAVKALTLALGSNTPTAGETPKLERGGQKDSAIASTQETSVGGAPQNSDSSGEVPNAISKSEDTTSISQTSSAELSSVTYDDVKRATNSVSKTSRDKAIAGLSRFGVASATKLAESQWPEYVEYMARVAAGEIDPESSHE